jgi:phage-related baseplate assembly protein
VSILFADANAGDIVSRLVAQFENALGETLQPSDERRIFINQLAQVVVGIYADQNDKGNNNILRYARGKALDDIGELFGVERIPAHGATVTLKFTLSEARSADTTIPQGTRATPDGKTYFATTTALTIPAGSVDGTVWAKCLTDGIVGNGFVAGQIKYIVDNVPFLSSVSNTTESSGGSDEESDDSLRDRIRLAPETMSTAGTIEGYEYHAKSASADVGDVKVYSPVNDDTLTEEERAAGAGRVYIYLLKADGTIPAEGDPVLDAVRAAVSAKYVRPLTDFVTVSAPSVVSYEVELTYHISDDDAERVDEIKEAVDAAVSEYIAWQDGKIGRDINPDRLRKYLLNAGASRVDIVKPVCTVVGSANVAKVSGVAAVTYSGLSE